MDTVRRPSTSAKAGFSALYRPIWIFFAQSSDPICAPIFPKVGDPICDFVAVSSPKAENNLTIKKFDNRIIGIKNVPPEYYNIFFI